MCLLVPEEFEMVEFMCLICQHFEGTFLGFQKLTLGNDGCQGDSIFGTCPQKDFPVCHNEKKTSLSIPLFYVAFIAIGKYFSFFENHLKSSEKTLQIKI